MAFTQDDLDAVNEAIASGAKSITFSNGNMVSYRSVPELKQAKAMIEQALAAQRGRRRPRAWVMNAGKGV